MRVVHLYDGHEQVYQGRGSVPGVVWHIARETAAHGHDVTVIERQWDGLDATAVHEGVTFDRVDLSTGADDPWTRVPYEVVSSPVGALRLVGDRTNFACAALRTLRRLEYDVVHVHLPFAANVIATVAPWLRKRLVYTAHLGELRVNQLADDADVDAPGVLDLFSPDLYLAKRAAYTTVLNPSIEAAFVDSGVPDDRVRVVPNGVDIDRFADPDPADLQRVRDRYDLDAAGGPFVLFVGTLMPRKGVLDLVEALGRAVDSGAPTPQVMLAGKRDLDEEYVRRVERRIADVGLESAVQLPGFVPAEDLPKLYALADLFVLPSLEEGFGMTAIEALAAGTPVVGTRVGALPEVIDETTPGRLVPPGDVEGLAEALADQLLTVHPPDEGPTATERADAVRVGPELPVERPAGDPADEGVATVERAGSAAVDGGSSIESARDPVGGEVSVDGTGTDDGEVDVRALLIERQARARASDFSWAGIAKQMESVYEAVNR